MRELSRKEVKPMALRVLPIGIVVLVLFLSLIGIHMVTLKPESLSMFELAIGVPAALLVLVWFFYNWKKLLPQRLPKPRISLQRPVPRTDEDKLQEAIEELHRVQDEFTKRELSGLLKGETLTSAGKLLDRWKSAGKAYERARAKLKRSRAR